MNETDTFACDSLRVRIFSTAPDMGRAAAADTAACLRKLLSEQETVNVIFAAAPSQIAFLEALTALPDLAWERVNAFHMDEYLGLSADAPQGFGNFLHRHLFDKVPFRKVFTIQGNADPDTECRRYARLLEEHPVDIVCLGIGENGHIAFNDPGVADFHDPVAVKAVPLDPVCRAQQVHDKCFDTLDAVPTHALTVTIPALLRARYMFCIVPFRSKADAVYHTLHDPVDEACPATILRRKEKSCLYLDAESASRLP